MSMTTIEWTQNPDGTKGKVWNPVRGCARVSPGCEHCYAERQAHRFHGKDQPYKGLTIIGKNGPRWLGKARFVPEQLGLPLRWRKPQRIFVNSMSDLFHPDVTNEQIAAVFGVMAMCSQHTFMILTKRPARMRLLLSQWTADDCWMAIYSLHQALGRTVIPSEKPSCGPLLGDKLPLPNVWLGVSVEDQKRAQERIPLLRQTPAAVRWLSVEPLLEWVRLDLEGIDWVVVGGESGPRARPCEVDWIHSVLSQCICYGVPCFVKQLGSNAYDCPTQSERVALNLQDSKGGNMAEWPDDLRSMQLRQFPHQPREARS